MPKTMTLRFTLLALACSSALAQQARAEDFRRIDVPAGDLTAALESLSRQSEIELVYRTEQLRGLRTQGASGNLSAKEAATKLLEGTPLALRTDATGAMLIAALQTGSEAASPQAPEQAARRNTESSSLEEIFVIADRAVTATKTDTKLIETPQAISVVTAEQFVDRGALLYEETLRYSASVNPESFGTDPRLSNAVVRGFIATNYVDGLRRGFGFANLARLDVYTLERVEVLRGPSSVLYGAGGAGGLINHVSKRPQFDSAREVGMLYGSYDRKQFQFDLTGPLGDSERFAARLVGVAREADTQVDFVPDDRLLLMPSLSWRPGESTELTLLGSWSEDRLGLIPQFHPLAASLLAPPGRRLPDSFFAGEPGFDGFDVDERSIALFVDHRFSDRFSFSGSARYVDSKNAVDEIYPDSFTDQDPSTPAVDPFIDAGNQVMPRFAYREDQQVEVFTIDNRLRFDVATGPLAHSFLAGVDYQRFDQTGNAGFDAAAPLNIFGPVYGNVPAVMKFPVPAQQLTQLGFYIQDQIDYADRVHVVLGARRDRATSSTGSDPEKVDHATTFRAAVIVDVWEGLSPYLSYAESFLPVAGFSTFNQDPFVPQEGTMYEAGVKWQPGPRTLLTLALFNIRETNRFTNHPTDPTLLIQQGEVRSRGVEIEASHRLLGDLDVTATYSFINAEITESNAPAEIGLQLDTTPEHQATVWGVKSFALGTGPTLRVGAGARYIGEHFSSGTLRLPSYTLVDALLALDWQQWSLAVNASNLLDERHYSTCLARGDCFIGIRRNVVGSVNYRF